MKSKEFLPTDSHTTPSTNHSNQPVEKKENNNNKNNNGHKKDCYGYDKE